MFIAQEEWMDAALLRIRHVIMASLQLGVGKIVTEHGHSQPIWYKEQMEYLLSLLLAKGLIDSDAVMRVQRDAGWWVELADTPECIRQAITEVEPTYTEWRSTVIVSFDDDACRLAYEHTKIECRSVFSLIDTFEYQIRKERISVEQAVSYLQIAVEKDFPMGDPPEDSRRAIATALFELIYGSEDPTMH